MVALFDIGNTHTHVGVGGLRRVSQHFDLPTADWKNAAASRACQRFFQQKKLQGAVLCSVVPAMTPRIIRFIETTLGLPALSLTHRTVCGVGIDYPKPSTIGADRLANAIAVKTHFGCPSVVVDFGTAVTFDVVNGRGNYCGGIIAPGLAMMTDYLHEKTALLPRIKLREVTGAIGKNTRDAMLIGATHGYRGLVRQLVAELKTALECPRLPVVATGGYGALIAARLPEITAVRPLLTLEGLRLAWFHHQRENDCATPALLLN